MMRERSTARHQLSLPLPVPKPDFSAHLLAL
jgi:hypothetical protein